MWVSFLAIGLDRFAVLLSHRDIRSIGIAVLRYYESALPSQSCTFSCLVIGYGFWRIVAHRCDVHIRFVLFGMRVFAWFACVKFLCHFTGV